MKLAERKQRKLANARIKYNEVMQEQDQKHKKQLMDEVLKEKMEIQAMAGVGAEELERLDSSSEELTKMKEQQDLQRKVEMNVLQEEQNVDKNLMEFGRIMGSCAPLCSCRMRLAAFLSSCRLPVTGLGV